MWLLEKVRGTTRRSLTVGHLARVVASGRWFEPGEVPEPGGGALSESDGTTMQPEFPIRVTFLDDGDEWVLDSIQELACSLEWFDSDDPEERVSVVDRKGRAVRIKVEALRVLRLELA